MKESSAQVLAYIRQAGSDQLNEIIQAVIHRYGQISPDWDVTFLSLPKNDPAQRQQMLRTILQSYEHD